LRGIPCEQGIFSLDAGKIAGNTLFSFDVYLGREAWSREFFAQAQGIFVPAQGNFCGEQGIHPTHGSYSN